MGVIREAWINGTPTALSIINEGHDGYGHVKACGSTSLRCVVWRLDSGGAPVAAVEAAK